MSWASATMGWRDGQDLEFLCRFIQERAGIALDAPRLERMRPRLSRVATQTGCRDLSELVVRLRAGRDVKPVIDAVTTNETSWFRDQHPFDAVLSILSGIEAEGRPAKVWCAACSTGQEPYSVAMLVDTELPGLEMELVGTDLSTAAIERAEAAVYSDFEVRRGVPERFKQRFFRPQERAWMLSKRITRRVRFAQANLLDRSRLNQVDLVMLRNVLIYFDDTVRRRVLENIREAMRPGAYLILGGSETIRGLDDRFEPQTIGRSACFRLTR